MPELFSSAGEKESDQIKKMLGGNCPTSVWGSFAVTPENLKFEAQQDGEEVIILGRRHLVTNLWWLALVCVAVFIPMVWGSFPMFEVISTLTVTKVTILWYLGLLFYVIQHFLLWFYNVYIVTSERLVDVDFTGLLSKVVNVTQLDNVEDVNYSQHGLMDSLFDMGDVIVQTASEQKTPDASGELSAFTFESIAYPDRVSQVINMLVDNEDKEHHHNK